jgi:hypothetical protein
MAGRAGYKGNLFIGSNQVTKAIDPQLMITDEELEDWVRGDSDLVTYLPGRRDCEIPLTLQNDVTDSRVSEIQDAWFNGTTLSNVSMADTNLTDSGGKSLKFTSMHVFGWQPGYDKAGKQIITTKLRPAQGCTLSRETNS